MGQQQVPPWSTEGCTLRLERHCSPFHAFLFWLCSTLNGAANLCIILFCLNRVIGSTCLRIYTDWWIDGWVFQSDLGFAEQCGDSHTRSRAARRIDNEAKYGLFQNQMSSRINRKQEEDDVDILSDKINICMEGMHHLYLTVRVLMHQCRKG